MLNIALDQKNIKALNRLLVSVAEEFGVSVIALRSPRIELPLPAIRAEFCRRAYAMECFSLPQIGRAINRDHSTVLYALGRKKTAKPSAKIERYLREHSKAV